MDEIDVTRVNVDVHRAPFGCCQCGLVRPISFIPMTVEAIAIIETIAIRTATWELIAVVAAETCVLCHFETPSFPPGI